MKFSAANFLLLAGSAMAAPVIEAETQGSILRRDLNARGLTDGDILNFALTLEHLENAFYKEALSKFTRADFDKFGSVARFRFNVQEISADEQTHVDFLTTALKAAGVTPVQPCSYNFGLTDVKSFLQLSSALEGVGVSAYLGAAAAISEPAYLTAAGSILTVEARHSAYIRDGQKPPQSPFPAPFDIPLDPTQVFTLASAFITSCPQGSNLPFTAFPALAVGPFNPSPIKAKMLIGLRTKIDVSGKGQLYCAWPNVAGTIYTKVTEVDMYGTRSKCTVPENNAGQTYVLLTTSPNALSDTNTVAGPAIVAVQSPYTYPGFPM